MNSTTLKNLSILKSPYFDAIKRWETTFVHNKFTDPETILFYVYACRVLGLDCSEYNESKLPPRKCSEKYKIYL